MLPHTSNHHLFDLLTFKKIDGRITGHYLLKKRDLEKLEVLLERFDEPHVACKRITDTPTIKLFAGLI